MMVEPSRLVQPRLARLMIVAVTMELPLLWMQSVLSRLEQVPMSLWIEVRMAGTRLTQTCSADLVRLM